MTALDIRPIAGALGAEIHGVDLSQDLDDATFDAVQMALHDHLVIFFRDQTITPDQHLAFARRFGEIETHRYLAQNGEEVIATSQIVRVKVAETGKMLGHGRAERPALGFRIPRSRRARGP